MGHQIRAGRRDRHCFQPTKGIETVLYAMKFTFIYAAATAVVEKTTKQNKTQKESSIHRTVGQYPQVPQVYCSTALAWTDSPITVTGIISYCFTVLFFDKAGE
jgi:hypothetical protein